MVKLRSLAVLFAAGAVSVLAMPPIDQWWVFGITLPVLLWQLERLPVRDLRGHGLYGGAFGFGYFCAVFHWIGFAFLVDATTYLWMMPFAVGGLALFMTLYWAAATAVASLVTPRILPRFASVAATLALAEWLRGHLLTGFPWAAPGLAADGMGGVLQLASVVGMPGLSYLVLLWAALPFALWQNRGAGIARLALPAIMLLTLPAACLWGERHLAAHPTTYRDGVVLRLVQPNISQDDKWRFDNAEPVFASLLELSGQAPAGHGPGHGPITHVIWPESSVSFLLDEEPRSLARIAAMLRPGRTLLAGAVRRGVAGAPGTEPYFTSIMMIDESGTVRGIYDKWRLVPGGEFLPFEWLLAPLGFRKVVSLPESFTAGPGPRALNVPLAGEAGMLICYEVIFPHQLLDARRPSWLVNVTNDGWFGNSVGPYQHLAQARMRAVEQGLAVARAANTGLSAVIDPVGRITAMSRLGDRQIIDGMLPKSLEPTPYAKAGDWALFGLVLVFSLGLTSVRRENSG